MSEESYVWGTGKRKCAVAQVRLYRGDGSITVNGKPYEELFPRIEHKRQIEAPFEVKETQGKFRAAVKVAGGGVSGQATAIRHGIARALAKEDESLKPVLRQHGLLTRDARIKERKKYGLRRARKAPQFTKR